MPRRKRRQPTELPTEEAIKHLFPREVVDKVKEVTRDNDDAVQEEGEPT